MRLFTLPSVASLALLGCTVNTYSAHTLPPAGFGMQAPPARVIAYGSGGDEGVAVAPRVARPAPATEAVAVAPRAVSQPDAAAKRPQGARPTRGVVLFARTSTSGGRARVASDARSSRAKAKAKSSRGLAPKPRRASESPRALAALGAAGSSEHGRADQREVLQGDADATMQLAQGQRSEHLHRADEVEPLAAQ